MRTAGQALMADSLIAGRRPKPGVRHCADPYYDRPAFSHGGFGLGACRQGAGHLPMALWAPNRLLAEHEAKLSREHHDRLLRRAAPHVPVREPPAERQPRTARRIVEVTVFPREETVDQPPHFAFYLNGRPCATLELVRGLTYTLDQSHFSNLGDEAGPYALRFFESDEQGAAEYTDGVSSSVMPPGMPGAHVLFCVGRLAPSVLYYRAARVDGPVHGGLVLIKDPQPTSAEGRRNGAVARRTSAAAPKHKPLDLADALAERQARVRANARLLFQRDARERTVELQAAPGGGTARQPIWNSRPRDPHHWLGGLPTARRRSL